MCVTRPAPCVLFGDNTLLQALPEAGSQQRFRPATNVARSVAAPTTPHPGGQVNVLGFICLRQRSTAMNRAVEFHGEFVPEFRRLHPQVQDEIYAVAYLLEHAGPQL